MHRDRAAAAAARAGELVAAPKLRNMMSDRIGAVARRGQVGDVSQYISGSSGETNGGLSITSECALSPGAASRSRVYRSEWAGCCPKCWPVEARQFGRKSRLRARDKSFWPIQRDCVGALLQAPCKQPTWALP